MWEGRRKELRDREKTFHYLNWFGWNLRTSPCNTLVGWPLVFLLNSIVYFRNSIRQRIVCLTFIVYRSEAWSGFLEKTQGKEVRHKLKGQGRDSRDRIQIFWTGFELLRRASNELSLCPYSTRVRWKKRRRKKRYWRKKKFTEAVFKTHNFTL